jgi:hypothetical protein
MYVYVLVYVCMYVCVLVYVCVYVCMYLCLHNTLHVRRPAVLARDEHAGRVLEAVRHNYLLHLVI